MKNENKLLRITLWLRSLWFIKYSSKYIRLSGSLDSYREELERRISDTASDKKEWAIKARDLLTICEKKLNQGNIDEAWKCFHAARRMEIFGLSSEELAAHAKILIEEIQKLSEWRRKAVQSLIGNSDLSNTKEIKHEHVYQALLIRDEHYNNLYYKNQLVRIQFRSLFIALFIILGLIFIFFLSYFKYCNCDNIKSLTLTNYIYGVILFGLLGATSSAILHIRKSSKVSRIPEIISNNYITLSRIFIGAAFSLIIFILLKTSFTESFQLFSFEIKQPFDYFTIAFISGFSERFVLSAIQGLLNKDQSADEKDKK